MANYVSVLAAHEAELIAALKRAGVIAGTVIGPVAYLKIKNDLDARGIPHQKHDSVAQVGNGRVHNY